MFDFNLMDTLMIIPGVLLGFSIHEYAHARVAYALGDSTPAEEGRLTLDFRKHIDPMGFLLIVFLGFGWAKPVQINPKAFKHPYRDEVLVSLAGPFSNLLLAFSFFAFTRLLMLIPSGAYDHYLTTASDILLSGGVINIALFAFNLIPLPPLDGSHLYMPLLSKKFPHIASKVYQYGIVALFALIIINGNTDVNILPIAPAIKEIAKLFFNILQFR